MALHHSSFRLHRSPTVTCRFHFDLCFQASDNSPMPSMKQSVKKASRAPAKPAAKQLSNAELLKLAARNRPPQKWYDEQVDPTKPATSNGRGR
jgi:hypothetical protein